MGNSSSWVTCSLGLQVLEVMQDDNMALCLTPQCFHNIQPETDLFNSINVQFWEYWLPGEL